MVAFLVKVRSQVGQHLQPLFQVASKPFQLKGAYGCRLGGKGFSEKFLGSIPFWTERYTHSKKE